jgi:hypothetical protein
MRRLKRFRVKTGGRLKSGGGSGFGTLDVGNLILSGFAPGAGMWVRVKTLGLRL